MKEFEPKEKNRSKEQKINQDHIELSPKNRNTNVSQRTSINPNQNMLANYTVCTSEI